MARAVQPRNFYFAAQRSRCDADRSAGDQRRAVALENFVPRQVDEDIEVAGRRATLVPKPQCACNQLRRFERILRIGRGHVAEHCRVQGRACVLPQELGKDVLGARRLGEFFAQNCDASQGSYEWTKEHPSGLGIHLLFQKFVVHLESRFLSWLRLLIRNLAILLYP